MSEPLDWIADATRAGTELREAIKQGHELLRDLKQTHRAIQAELRTLKRDINDTAMQTFSDAFTLELDRYTKGLELKASECMHELTETMIKESEKVLTRVMHRIEGESIL